jgi:hypothetical protein
VAGLESGREVDLVRRTGEPGSEFRWKAGPGTIVSTLEQVDRPSYIRWRGRTLSIKALHEWWFEPSNGGTRVETEESFSGLLARLFRGSLQKTLDRSTESGLEHLKRESERRAGPVSPPARHHQDSDDRVVVQRQAHRKVTLVRNFAGFTPASDSHASGRHVALELLSSGSACSRANCSSPAAF